MLSTSLSLSRGHTVSQLGRHSWEGPGSACYGASEDQRGGTHQKAMGEFLATVPRQANEKRTVIQHVVLGKLVSTHRRINVSLSLYHIQNLILNRSKTYTQELKLNTEKNLHHVGLGNDFMDVTPKSTGNDRNTDKLDFMKMKNFCAGKDTNKKAKIQCT